MINGKLWEKIAYVLVAVGALNWGLVEVLNFNLVTTVLGWVGLAGFATWVYVAIGLSGAWLLKNIFW